MKKRVLIAVIALLTVALLLGFMQALVVPKYVKNPEGLLVGEYYAEAGEHDVIFVGDCEVYETFIPAVLWDEYKISSYVRGSAQQLAWHSYYLLEDTLRYETPKAVVFNVYSLKYGEPQREEYNRMTLDSMEWSLTKIRAIRASMTDEEVFLDYVFPLLRYHSRITQLEKEDLTYMFSTPKASHSGYLMQKGIAAASEYDLEENKNPPDDLAYPQISMDYLEKMRALCEERGIELILIKAPTNSNTYWYFDEWDEQIREYAEEKHLAYYNLIENVDDMGIDFTKDDTYDHGLHLNVYGAEKATRYFGKILKDNHGLGNTEHTKAHEAAWSVRLEEYKKERDL